MGKNSKTVRTYSKRCPLKVMHISSSRLTTPDTLEEGGSTLPTPATPSYLKDLTPSRTSLEVTSTVNTGTGGGRTRSGDTFRVPSSRGNSRTRSASSKSKPPNASPNVHCRTVRPTSSGTTQRLQPTVDDTSVAQNSRRPSTDLSKQTETRPRDTVEDTSQRDTRSCMYETFEGAPLMDLDASKRLCRSCQTSRNTELLSMELTCCPLNSTCTGNTTTAVGSMQKESDNTVILVQGDSRTRRSSQSTSSKSATPNETNRSNNHNTVCVQTSLETCSIGARTHSSSHGAALEQSVQLQTLQDHSSTKLQSRNDSVNSSGMGPPSVDAGDPFELTEEEESEDMEVSEVMRTMVDDVRTVDPDVDFIPLEAKPPLSPLQEVEWPSMEDVCCKRKGSSNEAGTNPFGSEDVQTCAVIPLSQIATATPCGGNPSDCASMASKVSDNCSSRSTQLQQSEGSTSNDVSTRELSLSKSPTECLSVSCDLELDGMDDVAEGGTGECDSLPRSSTPLIDNLKGKLVAWDCSPVLHSITLDRLSAETRFKMPSGDSSSKSQEGNTRNSIAAASQDKGTDVVQQSIVRSRRRLTTGISNKRRASSQNCSWPKRMLKAPTSAATKLATVSREQHSKKNATSATSLNYDPYSFMCSNDSALRLPVIHAPPSLQSPSTSQTKTTSYTTRHVAEPETSLQAGSSRSVCAIIDIGGGGLPPAWTLLQKGPRQLRKRKGKGRDTNGTALPHCCDVDVLCTL